MQMHVCSFHSQVSFPSDSWSNEVNNDKKEGPELGLRSSDLTCFKAALKAIPTSCYNFSSAR